jgi:hypothetical protein
LLNTSFDNGRSGYYFTTTDGVLITFTGPANRQTKTDPDNAIEPIDAVIINHSKENKPVTLEADGQCKISNPNKGPAPVSCAATTPKGKFEAEFTSDGSPPDVKTFK